MTPAQLTTTMRAIFGEYKPSISSSELHQVLARVLGDEPEPPENRTRCSASFRHHPHDFCDGNPDAGSPFSDLVPPAAPLPEPATMVAKDRAEKGVTIEINSYQAANLRALLEAASKFGGFNTGDWLGELLYYVIPPTTHMPNSSAERMAADARHYIKCELQKEFEAEKLAYGDELLEKAAGKARDAASLVNSGPTYVGECVLSLKSTPPKDNR